MGYNPWGRKESDTNERLHFHFYVFFKKYSFIYFWLRWVFIATHGLCLVVESGG